MNKFLVIGFLGLFFISSVFAMSVDYYYSPSCSYCQKIAPFIQQTINSHNDIKWNLFDVSDGSYDVTSTPTLIIITDDGRNIEMLGSYEIPRYLECEINEQSNLNCPTYSANECRNDSWFIKE